MTSPKGFQKLGGGFIFTPNFGEDGSNLTRIFSFSDAQLIYMFYPRWLTTQKVRELRRDGPQPGSEEFDLRIFFR